MALDISKELVYRRRYKGLTQSELAQKAHISKGYLSQLESDPGKAVSAEILYRLCTVLGTGIENFYHIQRYCQRCGHDFIEGERPQHLTSVIGYACKKCTDEYRAIKTRHNAEISNWVNMRNYDIP